MSTLVQHVPGESGANANTLPVTITATGAGNSLIVPVAHTVDTCTISGVADDKGSTWVRAPSSAGSAATAGMVDGWYCLAPIIGVTVVTITYSITSVDKKNAEIFEFAPTGGKTFQFDTAAAVSTQTGTGGVCTGASVTTANTDGAVGALCCTSNQIGVNPKAGNEFTAGGDIFPLTTNAACSLLSTTAAAHTPVWEDLGSPQFCATTIALKAVTSGSPTLMAQICL